MKLDRRLLLRGAVAGGGLAALQGLMPAWAQTGSPGLRADLPTLTGPNIDLTIGQSPFTVNGRTATATTINGVLPAPVLRLREGQNVRLAVTNQLDEDTSIHWHGILLPFQMDGVPGVSFPGIRPRETFVYEFPVRQSGTFWYHSHSGLQEALGHYGPIVIDPAGADPVAYDREHVLVLSDWSFMHPHEIFDKLKKSPGYFNRQRTTLAGLLDGSDRMSLEERRMWGEMRMDPRDILDVNGSTYTYLINGHGPRENWTGLFRPGERVRLRIINASAMSIFNVRIPGLPMTVVQADGENVRPIETDEFQISVAETYDVIVQPTEDRAYTIVSEAIDRSGMGRATLAPRLGMTAEVPPLREVPNLTMKDMGMGDMGGMGGMDHGSMGAQPGGAMAGMDHGAMTGASGGAMAGMDHGAVPAQPAGAMPGMDHGSMAGMNMRDPENAPPDMAVGVGVDAIAMAPANRMGERPIGLQDVPHRVLVYTDLVSLQPNKDQRPPSRTMEIHLTGNMERFMWGFDGRKFSELVEPIRFERDERVRVTLVNDSMMAHPIHLHGHFFELVTGGPAGHQPLKHTVNVPPGGKVSFDLTADNPGDWAFHCHLLLHMHAGMFNVVTVRPMEGAAS
ncbi:MAG: copper resistance system multicopper oxidase [Alphaproteobacteria bacterium]|jgi:CopA family copper-resistance protein|uniref:CopA family copper-resistance protein n=3 Tax=Brevundimonas TaxID=41275 RepID=A0A6G7EI93_9CAUL|nr:MULTISPECIES: copper resistance system multicopper oxidase [Brevundimonas]MBU1520738.1 copper resistance system multicopper oxidase [Alphaproteobacteria bacterium]MEA3474094.1 copper resistance system multicopper oxidase [Pseudomonadota bacterium]ASE39283.1 copper resistance system multicopper oxidase [Brevundimonas vesicularis]KDP94550.1 copper-binding protein [Brevundimonas sp. EAKA]MBB3873130.1 CopA family copper-resistance protein [Brevundimonas mediterranea]